MRNSFFLFILLAVGVLQSLHAEVTSKKIEITAKYIDASKTVIKARENVIVYYADAVIKADSALYDKEEQRLVLDGNIEMIGYQGSKEHSNHMEIYTEKNEVHFDELFLASENDVWLFSDDVAKQEGNYTFGTSVLSSCDVEDPLWKMVFSRSHYDTNASYMKIYDAKIYMWDVPILYTPYMAFTTDNERSSGFLFPAIGYGSNEGILYEQPIFWAISPSMDLEVNPQIRTARSLGLYSTFRFVDSAYSSGQIRAGYFKDKQSYADKFNLPNNSHYGLEVNYESSKVFNNYLPEDFTDGLYINTTYLNDIDYLNLQSSALTHFGLTPLQESRVNYFTYNNDYYAGVYAKYFIDTRKTDNDDTMQILPTVQMHKYLKHFIWDNLTYSTDLTINNFDRKKGATLRQAEFNVPLEFTTSFFDDFFNVSLGEELFYSKFFFGNGDFVYDDFTYYSNLHKIRMFSDLTKKYDGFVHVLQPSMQYLRPGNQYQSPVDQSLLSDEQKALFSVGLPEEVYSLSLSQYFYDEAMNLKFFQRFTQLYYPKRIVELADMSNEMQYNWNGWRFYNNLIYSQTYDKVRESASTVSLYKPEYSVSLGHAYKEILPDVPAAVSANDVYFSFSYTYSQEIKVNGGLTYSIDQAESKQWRFGGSYHRDCWSVAASLRQDITPRPTGFTTDNTFFVQFNFIPFGSVGTGDVSQLGTLGAVSVPQ